MQQSRVYGRQCVLPIVHMRLPATACAGLVLVFYDGIAAT